MNEQDERRRRRPWSEKTTATYTKEALQRAPSSCRDMLGEFVWWLREDRGLAESTVALRVSVLVRFVSMIVDERDSLLCGLKELSAREVEDYFVTYCTEAGPEARRNMQAAMRLFLFFAVSQDWCKAELRDAVPALRTWRLAGVPRGLDEAVVARLLKFVSEGVVCARDCAIVHLLAVYGVRCGQVVALEFGDIDWRKRVITFDAHKGGRRVQHILTAADAAPLADYLRHERPDSEYGSVFLRRRRPYLPLGPGAVGEVVRSLLRRLGEAGRPCGPHALRHAFATRLLKAGQSMKTIADLLGHRSLSATSIYAKVDHPRLLEVAGEWPEVLS